MERRRRAKVKTRKRNERHKFEKREKKKGILHNQKHNQLPKTVMIDSDTVSQDYSHSVLLSG